ncbi:hypothetical protein [Pseudonocardia asaccharolytica]|uniref:hypothetical protein n=1 Tax=Pseudonocardia asaccharolytica TaxID=54010 RepID=UPI0003FF15B4|nr:hypothetical protein [Pseudonocardia asaccharolytica]
MRIPRLARAAAAGVSDDLVDRFPPHVLREYALLADGERGVVVGPRGTSPGCACPAGVPTRCSPR